MILALIVAGLLILDCIGYVVTVRASRRARAVRP